MRGILAVIAIGLMATVAEAQCRGGCSSCSNGNCNQNQSAVQVDTNAATIQQQEQQIRQLQTQIDKLSTTLQRMQAARNIASVPRDDSIVQIGRQDLPARIQPIQLSNQPEVLLPAPQTQVQAAPQRTTQVQVTPRARTGSRWRR